ncbi:SDR family oxidoreductase [Streptomyces sp. NPDC005012]|uniref:SDR family oxidoreductase n=1 Tax=Streptomyces sp. NPDC005012 TaxID=3154558 RepID=UPI0033AD5FCA
MNRSVVVTGGNRGIGLAVARAFAAAGDRVAVLHRGDRPAADLLCLPCDVTRTQEVEEALAEVRRRHGAAQILVSNAGVTDDAPVGGMTDDSFTRVVDTNLTGAFRLARAVSGPMLRARWGRMVFVSSVFATTGAAGCANYAASKAGLLGLIRSLAREFGRFGVTANTVSPGIVDTGMFTALPQRRRESLTRQTFVGRPGTADEVAAALLWLCGPHGGYVTGADIHVDGGLGLGG